MLTTFLLGMSIVTYILQKILNFVEAVQPSSSQELLKLFCCNEDCLKE